MFINKNRLTKILSENNLKKLELSMIPFKINQRFSRVNFTHYRLCVKDNLL